MHRFTGRFTDEQMRKLTALAGKHLSQAEVLRRLLDQAPLVTPSAGTREAIPVPTLLGMTMVEVPPDIADEAIRMIRAERKVDAIRFLRDKLRDPANPMEFLGLRVAKAIADTFQARCR